MTFRFLEERITRGWLEAVLHLCCQYQQTSVKHKASTLDQTKSSLTKMSCSGQSEVVQVSLASVPAGGQWLIAVESSPVPLAGHNRLVFWMGVRETEWIYSFSKQWVTAALTQASSFQLLDDMCLLLLLTGWLKKWTWKSQGFVSSVPYSDIFS